MNIDELCNGFDSSKLMDKVWDTIDLESDWHGFRYIIKYYYDPKTKSYTYTNVKMIVDGYLWEDYDPNYTSDKKFTFPYTLCELLKPVHYDHTVFEFDKSYCMFVDGELDDHYDYYKSLIIENERNNDGSPYYDEETDERIYTFCE